MKTDITGLLDLLTSLGVHCQRQFFILPPSPPPPPVGEGGYTVLPLSVRPSKIFFSATIDGRNLIFGHKLHIGTHFWTHQILTSCLPTWLVFIHIEHVCGGIISEL